MGRASESLMRPAVGRHHRSSRALTQDAPTLWDLLIFEIARPGMFIWRRGCRRESPPSSRSSFPPANPLFQFAGWHFSTPSAACVAVFLFFSSYVSVLRAPLSTIVTVTTALVVNCIVPTEKNAITLLNERGYIPRLMHPASYIAPVASRLPHDTFDSCVAEYSSF